MARNLFIKYWYSLEQVQEYLSKNFKRFKISIYVYSCLLACVCLCVYVCKGQKRTLHSPWTAVNRQLRASWYGCWDPSSGYQNWTWVLWTVLLVLLWYTTVIFLCICYPHILCIVFVSVIPLLHWWMDSNLYNLYRLLTPILWKDWKRI